MLVLHEICKNDVLLLMSKIKIDEKFRKDKFFKDWHNDIYICPNGLTLTRMNNNMQNGIEYNVYGTDNCFTCPVNSFSTTSKKFFPVSCL